MYTYEEIITYWDGKRVTILIIPATELTHKENMYDSVKEVVEMLKNNLGYTDSQIFISREILTDLI